MKIGFYGAARMVTGSNYLVETEKGTRFIVDCGLFQGTSAEEELNYRKSPYDPKAVDFVLLTHAHIDHSGRLPKFVADGFEGDIHATKATKDLAEIMLYDSAHIQEQDAENENRKRLRQGKELIQPLYDEQDVREAMALFRTHHYGELVQVADDVKVRFRDAGHILGSAFLEVWIEEKEGTQKVVFSGDLGMPGHLLMNEPDTFDTCDTLLMESTYGNSKHGEYADSLKDLMATIKKVTQRGGTVIIPSFAVGRTQELIFEMNNYYEDASVPAEERVPIYVDSPLANRATAVFQKNTDFLNAGAQKRIENGDNIFEFPNLHYITDVKDSMKLNMDQKPKVIISASGMATAGRIRHHLKHGLWNEKNAVIFVGYQAQGTLGRIILDGAKKVKLFGEWIQVRAEVYNMPGFSAHADSPELLHWLGSAEKPPKRIILIHGEEREMVPLSEKLEAMGFEVRMPRLAEIDEIVADGTHCHTQEYTPKISLHDVSNSYSEVQQLLDAMEERKVDLNDMSQEKLSDLQKTLNDLKANLLSLNMVTGK